MLSGLVSLPHEPVGRWFDACLKRQRSHKSVSVSVEDDEKQSDSDEEDVKDWTEEDKTFLLSLDATQWKVSRL